MSLETKFEVKYDDRVNMWLVTGSRANGLPFSKKKISSLSQGFPGKAPPTEEKINETKTMIDNYLKTLDTVFGKIKFQVKSLYYKSKRKLTKGKRNG